MVLADSALAEAKQAEEQIGRGERRGPLHGVPIAVKDLFYTQSIPTTAGMAIHRNFRPTYDATVVSRLRRAGAVLLGKLVLSEAACPGYHPDFPVPVSPRSPSHWPGTSSSGSGVATAAGLCTASLGTDTGGSICYPCALNGVTGLKPTWGRVSGHGVFALAPSLDHVGPMARSAEDAGHMLQAIAGPDVNDPTAIRAEVPDYLVGPPEVQGIRIGFDPGTLDLVEPEVAGVIRDALRTLEGRGAHVREVSLPSTSALAAEWGTYVGPEAAVVHAKTFPSRSAEYGPFMQQFLGAGRTVSGMDIARIECERRVFTGALAAVFGDLDLLIVPASPVTDLTLDRISMILLDPDELTNLIRFTAPFNFSGNPTITLPGGFDFAGMPIGFQLVARHLEEPLLVSAGRAFQGATDWHLRRPPV